MMKRRKSGFAMIAALMLMSLLAIIAIAVLSLSAADRRRAVRQTKSEVRESCAYSGLTYARTYFGNQYANWNYDGDLLGTANRLGVLNPGVRQRRPRQ